MFKKLKPYAPYLLPLALPFAIGALIGAYPGYQFYSYAWKDANFCISCHVHDYASIGWQESSHGLRTTCHDCHHQPLRAYMRETYVMLTKNPKFPKDLAHLPHIPRKLCESCHVSDPEDTSTITGPLSKEEVKKIPKVDQMYLHRVHMNAKTDLEPFSKYPLSEAEKMGDPHFELPKTKGKERPISCMDCHGGPVNRAHQFTALSISCKRCHSLTEPENGHPSEHHKRVKEIGCRQCHFQDFLVPADWSDPAHLPGRLTPHE